MLLRTFFDRTGGSRAVIAMPHGWVRTEMGGPTAGLEIAQSVLMVVDVLTGQRGCQGLFFLSYFGNSLDWQASSANARTKAHFPDFYSA
ncbi:short chain dehydrogenase [Hartmannibacter diazotrophicus]|uniref:Short chain dehydrogenase n=1 Tax=Hartmannibacter diazotrophicus TaxID=1482074 RepID=A0A2C9D1G8_9HYPH|nr:hypothetical protein [Hartmannibacter diazotrophicus]SON54029.1 short chain dehydrogenase [Hartmannibacter diazotrophicus]